MQANHKILLRNVLQKCSISAETAVASAPPDRYLYLIVESKMRSNLNSKRFIFFFFHISELTGLRWFMLFLHKSQFRFLPFLLFVQVCIALFEITHFNFDTMSLCIYVLSSTLVEKIAFKTENFQHSFAAVISLWNLKNFHFKDLIFLWKINCSNYKRSLTKFYRFCILKTLQT